MTSDSLFDLIGDDTYRPLRPTTKSKPVLKTKVEQDVQTVPLSALDKIWLDVLPLILPLPTQMMLRMHCRLLSFDGDEVRIGTTSQPLFKMASDRLPKIEAAFTKFCSRPIRASLEVAPVEAIASPPPATDLPRHIDWEGSIAQSQSDYGFFGNRD